MRTGQAPPPEPHSHQAEIDSIAQDWFLVMTSGKPSNHDRKRFQQWLEESPQHRQAYNELTELWDGIDGLQSAFVASASEPNGDVNAPTADKVVQLTDTTRPARQKITIKRKFWSGAIAACLALLMINASNLSTHWMSDHRTAVGEQAQVQLPDGSVAWLNTDTAIDVRYSDTRREIVLLQGEAQFDVQKKPSRPFVVTADQGQSTALGTLYAVRKSADSVRVTVTEGTVEVVSLLAEATTTAKDSNVQGRVILHQGEQTHYTAGHAPAAAEKAHAANLAWRQGYIAIRNQQLAEALKEIDRYHPGRIVLMADTEKLQAVTARLAIHSVDNGLDALAATQGLKVTRLTDYLVLIR
jgi:transmembrane sensor